MKDLLGALPIDYPILRGLEWLTLAMKATEQWQLERDNSLSRGKLIMQSLMNKTLNQERCEDKCQLIKRPQLQMNKTSEADMSGGSLPYAFELSSNLVKDDSSCNSFTSLLPSSASSNSNTSSNDSQFLISMKADGRNKKMSLCNLNLKGKKYKGLTWSCANKLPNSSWLRMQCRQHLADDEVPKPYSTFVH
ncbi:hypothetical protein SADUNF_Sadunf16G0261200 [Salix dunnii]|uniref:Uncharacterized protein n=1 Tax=Salix dunnii TaxID=1413687 RepID=A0A835JAJ2_9ROSI|nr:hypothetical protein SADUNF_Sadunf16G0261200 [Salix dunnii]